MAKETTFEHPPKGHFGIIAYDSVNDRWQAVHVDADGNLQVDITTIVDGQVHLYAWDGDSWEALQVDANKYLKVTLPIEEALGARSYQYTGSAWVRSNLLFGYNDRWVHIAQATSTGGAETIVTSEAVPEGYVYVCTGLAVYHNDTAARVVNIALSINSSRYYFTGFGSVTQNQWDGQVVNAVLKEDDVLSAHFMSLANGKIGHLRGVGYKMKIDM